MTNFDIARQRLCNQHITKATSKKPGDVVGWLGAVQAQDYLGALWAIGLRMRNAAEKDIEQAIADKTIVRTWFMRGTLHFVPASDIRWMLALFAPYMRSIVDNVSRYNKLDLDDATFAKGNAVLAKALQGGKQLMRPELKAELERATIPANGLRLSLILQRAQADGLICCGARRGKQVTYTLLDEWVPTAKTMERDEALAELARRYFASHGPATLQDFVGWSGLTTADARAGLAMAKPRLVHEVIDSQTYWFSSSMPVPKDISRAAYLLPNYDEYVVGYKDRSTLFDALHAKKVNDWNDVVFSPTIVIDGRIVGNWKRTFKKDKIVIAVSALTLLTKAENRAVAVAAHQYGAFLDLPVVLA